MRNIIDKLVKSFFEKLGVSIISLVVEEKQEDIFFAKLNTEDSGLLIGNNGSTFEAIQGIIRSMLNNKFNKKIKFFLEINNYVYNRDSKLFAFIDREIEKAKKTGRNMKLPKFSAYERKKIHDYIGSLNDLSISTKSMGEGNERRIFIILEKNKIIKEKKISLTIDLDGDDI